MRMHTRVLIAEDDNLSMSARVIDVKLFAIQMLQNLFIIESCVIEALAALFVVPFPWLKGLWPPDLSFPGGKFRLVVFELPWP